MVKGLILGEIAPRGKKSTLLTTENRIDLSFHADLHGALALERQLLAGRAALPGGAKGAGATPEDAR